MFMKHHFADFLIREGDYWTIIPNRERYAHKIDNLSSDSADVSVITIEGGDENWERVLDLPNLVELTLHQPTEQQMQVASKLVKLKRLRVTHARPKNLSFISPLERIEELVLEYVSGFSDLSPLRSLRKLKSLHLENLRRVSRFDGLSGIETLRYLMIDGTLDWKQPIEDFIFLKGLPRLEVLRFGGVITKAKFPALLPSISLKHLKEIKVAWNVFSAEEYALLEVGLPHVKGACRGPFTRFKHSGSQECFEFTGKGAGRVKCDHPDSKSKCAKYAELYESLKVRAKAFL